MADIDLVIKIPEEIYQRYKKVWQKRRGSIPESNIAFGTPLKKGVWLRMSNLSENEDDRYKCSRCGNVVYHNTMIDLYTFNSWCGRCGSNNCPGIVEYKEELK